MITVYFKKSTEANLEVITQPVSGSWFNVVAPTAQETAELHQVLGVPQDFVTHPLDLGELARTEKENGSALIVLRVPHFHGEHADIPYVTVPLGIILTDKYIATVCKVETGVIQEVIAGRARGLSTAKHNRFVLQLLFITANRFLSNVLEINRLVDETEDRLQASLRNREVLELLKFQKSLTYFTTALASNEVLLQHLQREHLFQQYPDDQDLLEDVLTEIQQAIGMANISSNILSQMMDAFASIISNNLNVVMKFLASVTIILSLPTLIASFYGMNVALPAMQAPWAFPLVILMSVVVSVLVALVFWKKDWL